MLGDVDSKDRVIAIETRYDGDVCHLSITDNGPGVPENVREHLFQ